MILKIEGVIAGRVNDARFKACTSGFLDTDGEAMNHFELAFTEPVPPGFNPIAVGHCYNSSYHGIALKALTVGGSTPSSLFALSSGAYVSSRSVEYPTLGDSSHFEFASDVSVQDGIISTQRSTIEGRYEGPLDLIGVSYCKQVWQQGSDETQIVISTTADINRAGGDILPVKITTTYSGLSKKLPVATQHARHFYGNQLWTGRIMSFDWVGILHV